MFSNVSAVIVISKIVDVIIILQFIFIVPRVFHYSGRMFYKFHQRSLHNVSLNKRF